MPTPRHFVRTFARSVLIVCFVLTLFLIVLAAYTYSFPKALTATLGSSPAERTQLALASGELLLRVDYRWSKDPAASTNPSLDDPYTGAPTGSGLSFNDTFPPLTPGQNEEFQSALPGIYTLARTKPLSPTQAARTSTTVVAFHVGYLLAPLAAASAIGVILLRKKPVAPAP